MDPEVTQNLYRKTYSYQYAMIKKSIMQVILRRELSEPRWENDDKWIINNRE